MDKKPLSGRFILIFCVLSVFVALCIGRLFSLQIIHGEEYRIKAENSIARAATIKAPRGEILDRYGIPLVTNSMGYYIRIQGVKNDDSVLNDTIFKLLEICTADEIEYVDEFPVTAMPYKFDFGENTDENAEAKWKEKHKFEKSDSAEKIINYYFEKYNISEEYDNVTARNIAAVRYTMETKGYSNQNPYTFASEIGVETVHKLKECSFELEGVSVEIEPVREYPNGHMAAHILGRTGIIYSEEYELLKDKGYGMNDSIGKDGLEKVLESYLKGKDGYKKLKHGTADSDSPEYETVSPETENYAILTLDSGLQRVTEESLQRNIDAARAYKGFDCFSGAAVAVEIKTGEVLAMASLPNYDPANYNKDYEKLFNDPNKPLFNRALNGAYTPGSTFKPMTAVAALEEGIISPNDLIDDKGKYSYYAPSYEPTCLIWKNTGETHGMINVSQAIGVSCNYFFYEVGRRLTIEKLVEYAYKFGLGENTGIELSESSGIVAGPEYREKRNMEWYPGDTLQASIGQSDNMFTPAQLASYISTIINGGKRYSLHLVKEVRSYETGEVVYKNEPRLLSETEISQTTVDSVMDGMRRVTEDGTAKAVFEDFPIEVGGKTGTAEVGNGSDTVLFVGFAPYDNPQIAVAVVLEHGASSSFAASVARDMMEEYLGLSNKPEGVKPFNKLLER